MNINFEFGSRKGDVIIAEAGNNDIIFAGRGNDVIFAGDGDDVVFGGRGFDMATYLADYDAATFKDRWGRDVTESENDGKDYNFGIEAYLFGLDAAQENGDLEVVLNAFSQATNNVGSQNQSQLLDAINQELNNRDLDYIVNFADTESSENFLYQLEEVLPEPNDALVAVAYGDNEVNGTIGVYDEGIDDLYWKLTYNNDSEDPLYSLFNGTHHPVEVGTYGVELPEELQNKLIATDKSIDIDDSASRTEISFKFINSKGANVELLFEKSSVSGDGLFFRTEVAPSLADIQGVQDSDNFDGVFSNISRPDLVENSYFLGTESSFSSDDPADPNTNWFNVDLFL